MPELPDVEGFRRILGSCAGSGTIRRVEVLDAGVLNGVSEKRLREALEGRRFAEPERHGKWLLARTRSGGPVLALHFGMTGQLLCGPADEPPERHERVLFTLGRGRRLCYRDQRKLQGLWLLDDDAVEELLRGQGPDAATVGGREFEDSLSSRRGRVKIVLTDQSVVAGLGNLLADEILWRARVRPDRPARDLTHAELHRLYTQMRRTLRSAVAAGCVPPRNAWLTGRRDDPEPTCPRCHHALRRTRLAGRGTVWCPVCQRDGARGREAP